MMLAANQLCSCRGSIDRFCMTNWSVFMSTESFASSSVLHGSNIVHNMDRLNYSKEKIRVRAPYAMHSENWGWKPSELYPCVVSYIFNFVCSLSIVSCSDLAIMVSIALYGSFCLLEIGVQCDDCQLWIDQHCASLFKVQYTRLTKFEKHWSFHYFVFVL